MVRLGAYVDLAGKNRNTFLSILDAVADKVGVVPKTPLGL
jgi:hypothetical protein